MVAFCWMFQLLRQQVGQLLVLCLRLVTCALSSNRVTSLKKQWMLLLTALMHSLTWVEVCSFYTLCKELGWGVGVGMHIIIGITASICLSAVRGVCTDNIFCTVQPFVTKLVWWYIIMGQKGMQNDCFAIWSMSEYSLEYITYCHVMNSDFIQLYFIFTKSLLAQSNRIGNQSFPFDFVNCLLFWYHLHSSLGIKIWNALTSFFILFLSCQMPSVSILKILSL